MTDDSARQRAAQAWQAERMRAGDWVSECHFSRSGYAVWFKGDTINGACTCIAVPKSYVQYLPNEVPTSDAQSSPEATPHAE